jgi:uncharacterized protein
MAVLVQRIDVAPARLGKFSRTGAGGVRLPATISRTGCQRYGERVEYRPDSEVFAAESLATLPAAAVTRGHPPEPVTAANWKTYSVGHVGEAPPVRTRLDAYDWVETQVVLSDADTIAAAERGDVLEVSAGYSCELDETPGVAPDGTRYDAVQRNIRFNHLAVLGQGEKARAGADARLRLDSKGNPLGDPEENMVKIVIDGVEFEKGSDQHLAHIQAQADKKIAESQAKLDAAAAERDAARKDSEEARKASAPERIDSLVSDALKLRADASKLLPSDYKFDGKSSLQIRTDAVVAKRGAEWVKDKSEAYVTASFDVLLADVPAAPAAPGYVGKVPGMKTDAAEPTDLRVRMSKVYTDSFGKDAS